MVESIVLKFARGAGRRAVKQRPDSGEFIGALTALARFREMPFALMMQEAAYDLGDFSLPRHRGRSFRRSSQEAADTRHCPAVSYRCIPSGTDRAFAAPA